MRNIVRIFFLSLLIFMCGSFASAQERAKVESRRNFAKETRSPLVSAGVSDFPLESFENNFLPDGWSKITNAGGIGWQRVAVDSNVLGFQPPAPADAPPAGGNFVAFASWATGDADGDFTTGQAIDQWLITPKILNIQNGDTLKFYLRRFSRFIDNLDVKISTTNADSAGSFTVNVATISFSGQTNIGWQPHSYVLTDFVEPGSDIFIAFRERVTDTANQGDALLLDLVEVSSLVTSVRERNPEAPASFALEQNYPNPFNPTTRIAFQLPADAKVTLKVYNLLGQVVASLIDGEFYAAGRHSVRFDAGVFPNGIYFYRLQAGNFSDVKRMTLIK